MSRLFFFVAGLWILCVSQDDIEVDTMNGKIKGIRRLSPHASWTKYIHCETCEYATDKLYYMYDSFKDGPDWGEDTLIDILHDICNPYSNIGLWTTTIDLYVDIERYLTFDQNDKFGMCRRECETIARACQEVISDNAEEIAEWIWNNHEWIKKQNMNDYICDTYCGDDTDKPKVSKKKKKKEKMGKEEWIEMTDEELKRRRAQLQSVPKHQRRWGSDRKQEKPKSDL
eukprot:47188_1